MSAALYDTLRTITTATITTILLKKGIRRCWMNGPRPLVSGGARTVGPAFTLRFVPVREDLATPESWAKPISTRGAIEEMPADCIAVADAMERVMESTWPTSVGKNAVPPVLWLNDSRDLVVELAFLTLPSNAITYTTGPSFCCSC